MNAGEVAQNCDAGDVFPVERKDAGGLGAQAGGSLGRGDVAMHVFVVHIVGRGDLGEQAGNHFDDVAHGH